MASIIASEYRKMTTTRTPWLLVAGGPGLVVAGVSGLVLSGADLRDPAVQDRALAHVGVAALLTLLLGIVAVAGEYRHGTITDTYLSYPARGRVLLAKLAVYSALGALAGILSSLVAVAAAAAWWAAKGTEFHFSGGIWLTLLGGVAANIAFAALGVSLGALIRNLVGAVAAALAWMAVIEGIVGQLVGSGPARWLPFYASEALDRSAGSAGLLPQWGGGLVLLVYVSAFAVAAMLITLKRDVT